MDKLNAISVFCKVVETKSFTQTAMQQNISVAMASKLVSQLEEQLKTRLLQRTTRTIVPTEAGLIYYQHCQPILSELQEAEANISNLATALQGKLNISVPRDFGLLYIAPNLEKFLKSNPNLQVEVEFSDRTVDLISEGFDLALRIGNLQDSSLIAQKIATFSMHIVGSPTYFAQNGTPKTLEDLYQHKVLLYKSNSNQNFGEFTNGKRITRLKLQTNMICNSGLALTEFAKSGLGIINSPKFLIENELKSGELIEILTEYPQKNIDLNIVYPYKRHLSAKIKAFINFIRQLHLE
ncbi:LysR family transcriptional regulator [Avibacterium paragallinarum]|uniref:LysR family transcriptional regulator n=1 Tax=Avibacterium paragallinarum TaxID=728 RepID=UPI00397C0BF2